MPCKLEVDRPTKQSRLPKIGTNTARTYAIKVTVDCHNLIINIVPTTIKKKKYLQQTFSYLGIYFVNIEDISFVNILITAILSFLVTSKIGKTSY